MPHRSHALSCAVVVACVLSTGGSATAADPAHDPVVRCEFWRTTGAIVFGGVAQAPTSHDAPTRLTIVCRFLDEQGGYTSINSAPGYIVETAGTGMLKPGIMTVCGSADAYYADGHTGHVEIPCHVA